MTGMQAPSAPSNCAFTRTLPAWVVVAASNWTAASKSHRKVKDVRSKRRTLGLQLAFFCNRHKHQSSWSSKLRRQNREDFWESDPLRFDGMSVLFTIAMPLLSTTPLTKDRSGHRSYESDLRTWALPIVSLVAPFLGLLLEIINRN